MPENLRRIEFRRIRGEADQLDIVWHDQPLGPMGGRPIENHDDLTVRVSLSHLTQKCSHEVGIHGVGDHPVQSSLLRAKGGIDIAELPDKGFQDRGTEGPGSPASGWIAHTSESGFVLEKKQKRIFVSSRQLSREDSRFFFKSSCSSGFALGWRVSGVTLRHPCRANIR